MQNEEKETKGYRLTKITTKSGDDGLTNLGTRERLPKNHPRIEALGNLDELNSAIGVTLATSPNHLDIIATLREVQQNLFSLGRELCPPYRAALDDSHIKFLEEKIAIWNANLPPLKEFILPSGNIKSATCHLARTICRRAERALLTLHQQETLHANILRYMNRLSDLLFIAARILARESSTDETLWQP